MNEKKVYPKTFYWLSGSYNSVNNTATISGPSVRTTAISLVLIATFFIFLLFLTNKKLLENTSLCLFIALVIQLPIVVPVINWRLNLFKLIKRKGHLLPAWEDLWQSTLVT